jgi:hypothetical protein
MASEQRVRFWGASGIFVLYGTVMCCYLAMSLYLLIAGALERKGAWPVGTGIFMLVTSLPIVAWFVRGFGRPVVVDHGALQIPKGFSTTVLPLSDISGVGLVYRRQPRAEGWWLEVWDATGERVEIRRFVLSSWSYPRLAPGAKRQEHGQRDWTIPVPHENADDLAASKPGRVAACLYDAVMSCQGSGGRLAVQAMQEHVEHEPQRSDSPIAWWSPDGSMGRAKGLPPADPSKLEDPALYKV